MASDRYRTVGLLSCEQVIVEGAGRRRHEQSGVLEANAVNSVLADWEPQLNDDQAAAVRALTSAGDGVAVVTAVAGSGKTTMIGAMAACYRQAGWEVLGVAATARAARQLRETAGIPAETMHALLRLVRTSELTSSMVVVLDEASMPPTRLTAQLFALAEEAGAKVVAVGDPGQLGAVQAGGWLAAITEQDTKPALAAAVRQNDAAEREALQALHSGDPAHYLEHKEEEIAFHQQAAAALEALIAQWEVACAEHGVASAVMIARDNHNRELANLAARSRLKRAGSLPEIGVIIGGREYAAGDRVIARRNEPALNIDNGTVGTVLAIDERRSMMTIEADDGRLCSLGFAYVAAHLQHAYALTAHGAQGSTFHWAGVIGRPVEFTREWAYTALSRARGQTTVHLIAEPAEPDRERDAYAPLMPATDDPAPLATLQQAMKRRETEDLALHQLQPQESVGSLPYRRR